MRNFCIKKVGNRVFSYLLNTSIAFMLIIGNSSYTINIKGQSIDSLKPVFTSLEPHVNGSKSIQISIPSKIMIRRADAEIGRNIKEYFELPRTIRIANTNYSNGDNEISLNFTNSHYLQLKLSSLNDNDLIVDLSFKAENIEFGKKKKLNQADIEIHQDFLCLFLISTGNQINYLLADTEINKLFYTENP